ncbi:hypothetical protein ACOBQX_28520 [Actinokineospora sp. G85]|uniref:hypothetical protein n=1 Tax=Actinokineospora sp. G85 TaxID=3406626 RepID=UPI003C7340CD
MVAAPPARISGTAATAVAAVAACAVALVVAWHALDHARGLGAPPVPGGAGGHGHGPAGGPSSMTTEPLAHVLGVAVVAAHAAIPLLLLCGRGAAGLTARWRPGGAGQVIALASAMAVTGVLTALVGAWIAVRTTTGGTDGVWNVWLLTSAPVARYCFLFGLVAAVLAVVLGGRDPRSSVEPAKTRR